MVYLVFLWILNVIGLRGCIIADFYFGGKRVVGVNVRPRRGGGGGWGGGGGGGVWGGGGGEKKFLTI